MRGKDYEQTKALGPLGLGYLSGYLKHTLNFSDEDIVLEVDNPDKLLRHGPDIIGVSSFTETFEDVIKVTRHLKRVAPEIPIIVGGEHISALPESLPETVDIGVCGEGEETFTDIIRLYLNNQMTPENLAEIKGIVFWHKGERVITPARNWIMDLDSIPMPDRFLLHRDDEIWQQAIFTARGCPYKCTFCASTKFWQKTRYHSVQRVVDELEFIVGHFPKQPLIGINDDLFPLNKKRMAQMVEAIRARGLHKKVGFTLNARASVFDDEIAEMVARMNAQIVCFGFESASDRILKQLKGKTSASENQRALDLCEKYGFTVVGNFMVGSSHEEPEDMARTYWFIQRNRDRIWRPSICFSTPFPGTEFWWEAKNRQLIGDDFAHWNVLDLGFVKGESIYMNQHVGVDEFEPIFEQFTTSFNPGMDQSKSQFFETRFKLSYLESVYERLAPELEQCQRALEISGEGLRVIEALQNLPTGLLERRCIQQGNINLADIQGPFDRIILTHALEKIQHPEQLLAQLKPLLSDKGELLVLSYNAWHASFLTTLLYGHWRPQYFGIHQKDHLHYFTPPLLQKLLTAYGFRTREIEHLKIEHGDFEPFYEQIAPLLEAALPLENMKQSADAFSLLLRLQKSGLPLLIAEPEDLSVPVQKESLVKLPLLNL